MIPAQVVRTLVVDEDARVRRFVSDTLAEDPDVQHVGGCACGEEALKLIEHEAPDLVFLQLDLPDLDGLAVLEHLDPCPMTVFLASCGPPKSQVFEFHPVDYLEKPLREERIRSALLYAKERARQQRASRVLESLRHTLDRPGRADGNEQSRSGADDPEGSRAGLHRIVVRRKKQTFYLHPRDIEWIEGADYMVRIHAGEDEFLARRNLKDLAAALEPHGFFRLHKSYIVRLDRVIGLKRSKPGKHVAILKGGVELPVSRRRRGELDERLRAAE